MPKQTEQPLKPTGLRLKPSKIEKIDRKADKEKKSRGKVIRELIDAGMEVKQ